MMVYGRVNRQDTTFANDGGDTWVATVPGGALEYFIELWAVNDAGVESYMSTVKLAYDVESLCFRFSVEDVASGWTETDVMAMFGGTAVQMRATDSAVRAEFGVADVQMVVDSKVKCGGGYY